MVLKDDCLTRVVHMCVYYTDSICWLDLYAAWLSNRPDYIPGSIAIEPGIVGHCVYY